MKNILIITKLLILSLITMFLVSCDDTLDKINIKAAVLTDIHYYSPDLRAEGAAFESYISKNFKLVTQSNAITDAVIDDLKTDDTEIVIIPGDLTKDGEKINHIQMAEKLQELENAGKKVYVINGNHDINNPEAVEYYNDTTYSLETVSPEEFENIYNEFGFSEAIARDSDSLSYIVEPIEGLWIMAIDSCIYKNNLSLDHSVVGGRLSEETKTWIKDKLVEAGARGKVISCFMHHGLIPHFSAQTKMFPNFVIEDHETISKLLSDGGVKVVFTGHFHAQDISKKRYGLNVIHDIQTSSLNSYPCAYRKIEVIKGKKLVIKSKRVEQIDYDLGNTPFQEYAYDYAFNGTMNYSPIMVAGLLVKSGVPEDEAMEQAIAITNTELAFSTPLKEIMARALLVHSDGGELLDPKSSVIIVQMLASKNKIIQLLGGALFSLWTDITPFDNDTTLFL